MGNILMGNLLLLSGTRPWWSWQLLCALLVSWCALACSSSSEGATASRSEAEGADLLAEDSDGAEESEGAENSDGAEESTDWVNEGTDFAEVGPREVEGEFEGPMATELELPERCQRYAEVRCARLEVCLGPPEWTGTFTREELCRTSEAARCARHFPLPGSSLTEDGMDACITALQSADCPTLRGKHLSVEACLSGPGDLLVGDPCVTDHQCESGLCRGRNDAGCEICDENLGYDVPWEVYPQIEETGQPPSSGDTCANGYLENVDGICVERDPSAPGAGELSTGAGCGGEALGTCAPGLVCKSNSDLGVGSCGPWQMLGDACTSEEWWCEPGTRCDFDAESPSYQTCATGEWSVESPIPPGCEPPPR